MSDASSIVAACLVRLEAITTANGYATGMGDSASIAAPQYNPDEITSDGAVNVYDTDDEALDTENFGVDYQVGVDVVVEGYMRIGTGNAVTLAHSIVSDIKTAMLDASDRTLGGLAMDVRYSGRAIEYPKSDGDVVGAQVRFSIIYMEQYGAP